MKKLILKIKSALIARWNAETPKIAKALQWICGFVAAAMAALTAFWGVLPDELKQSIPSEVLKHTVYIGSVSVLVGVFLKFLKTKGDGKN